MANHATGWPEAGTSSLTTPALAAGTKQKVALALLLAASLLIKFLIWQQPPQLFNDSTGYLVPAVGLLDGRGYGAQQNGFRAPTYPLFLAAVIAPLDHSMFSRCRDAHRTACLAAPSRTPGGRLALRAITAVQASLGLLVTILLFLIGWQLTRNTLVALLVGAGYALNVTTAFWEISILTETLTTFLLVLAIYLTLRPGPQPRLARLALGLVLGGLALCHPLYIVSWVIQPAFLFVRGLRSGWRAAAAQVAPVAAIPALLIALWSGINYRVNGTFSPSTLGGFVLIQMVAPVVQNAPGGYDGITQIYVGYRDAMIAETGSFAGTIFRAYPAILEETGLTWTQLSQKLTALSLYLIRYYPGTYLSVVAQSNARFWDHAFYHYGPVPAGLPVLLAGFAADRVQDLLNLLFWLALPALGVVYLFDRRRKLTAGPAVPYAAVLLLAGLVWAAAVFVALTTFGDNARYRTSILPLEYGVIVLTAWAGWVTFSSLAGFSPANRD
ncbi:MAG: hypothetical protein ACM3JD_03095 [Rudaea sp.]